MKKVEADVYVYKDRFESDGKYKEWFISKLYVEVAKEMQKEGLFSINIPNDRMDCFEAFREGEQRINVKFYTLEENELEEFYKIFRQLKMFSSDLNYQDKLSKLLQALKS